MASHIAATSFNQYFLGTTRFSLFLPGSPAWNLSGKNPDIYLSELYSDSRMMPRLDIFINRSLPQMALMSEGFVYTHVVMCSSLMPSKHLERLYAAAQEYSFLRIQLYDKSGNADFALREVLKDKDDGIVGLFRVDDDDLLSIDYLNRLSAWITDANVGMAISFGKGYAAYYQKGRFSEFRSSLKPFIAIGQCYVCSLSKGIIDIPSIIPHAKIHEYRPVILDSRKPAFIHTHHASQDTYCSLPVSAGAFLSEAPPQLLELPRAERTDEICELFPVLRSDLEAVCKEMRSKGA